MIEIGKQYGLLTCLAKDSSKDSRYYLFKCECGNVKSIISYNVEKGFTQSCGCIVKANPNHMTYGFSHTRIDNIYKSMVSRCKNENNTNYKTYGGRGICVCDEWLNDKTLFFDWAFNNGYSDKLTIDRIDVNGNYTPDNCRWVSYVGQNNNRRSNRFITHNGETHTVAEWARIGGLKYKTFYNRVFKQGWDIDKALKGVTAWK